MDGARPSRWTLTITCPRPRNLAGDEFHLRADRLAASVRSGCGPDAHLILTARTVRFSYTTFAGPPDLDVYQNRVATVLAGRLLDIECDSAGRYRLPRPVRCEIREEVA